jgi:diguanylate cyclase (GGDEF)-like protein
LLGRIRREELLARYGGEEFCVVLPQTTEDGLRIAGERLRQAVASRAVDLGEHGAIQVTVSVGGCCLEQVESAATGERLIELADRALYRAKEGGRNRVEIEVAAPAAT